MNWHSGVSVLQLVNRTSIVLSNRIKNLKMAFHKFPSLLSTIGEVYSVKYHAEFTQL